MRSNLAHHLRRQAFSKQRGCCYYCNFPMWKSNPEKFARQHGIPLQLVRHAQCSAEHLIARQDGGRDTRANVVAACTWCNLHRHKGRANKAPDAAAYKRRVMQLMLSGRWHPLARGRRQP